MCKRGFTLIEMLIAIAILAAMTVITWRGIDGMVRSQQQAQAYSDDVMVVQAALAQWSTDLNAMVRVAKTTPLDWNGDVLRITRRSSDLQEQGLRVVAWRLGSHQGRSYWLRWQSAPLRDSQQWRQAWETAVAANTSTHDGQTALMPVRSWQLLYFRGNSWSNPLSSSAVSRPLDVNNPTSVALPDGVRLRLELPEPAALAGTITQDWLNPLVGGNQP